jgi:hypothetical protein
LGIDRSTPCKYSLAIDIFISVAALDTRMELLLLHGLPPLPEEAEMSNATSEQIPSTLDALMDTVGITSVIGLSICIVEVSTTAQSADEQLSNRQAAVMEY